MCASTTLLAVSSRARIAAASSPAERSVSGRVEVSGGAIATPPFSRVGETRRLAMRRLLLLVSAIVFVDTMFYAAITPLLPRYSEELGLSKSAAGVLTAAYPA